MSYVILLIVIVAIIYYGYTIITKINKKSQEVIDEHYKDQPDEDYDPSIYENLDQQENEDGSEPEEENKNI